MSLLKYEKYIDKLMSNDTEDLEEGLLFELEEKPPKELHRDIMKAIGNEKKKELFRSYKKYASAVAAVLIFAVLLRGFNWINSTKYGKIATKESIDNDGSKKIASIENNPVDEMNISGIESIKEINDTTISINNGKDASSNAEFTTKIDNTNNKNNRGENTKKDASTRIASDEKKVVPEVVVVPDAQTLTVAGKSENDDNQQTKNESDEEVGFKIMGFMSICPSPFEINYEIKVKEAENIINYVKENSSVLDENNDIYKMSKESFKGLQESFIEESIEITVLNEPFEEDEFIVVKIIKNE